jgi:Ras-related protein Rab-21
MAGKAERFKVVLLGEGRVGKTSILLRFTKGEYNDRQVSTLQASYLDKRINVGTSTAHLSVWDTAGQERFHALGPIYYRDADAALLVYDITDAESFTKVKKWVKELRKIVGNDIVIAIAGNKIDLEKSRNVNEQEAIKYAESVGASHFNTSAKANKGLDEVFLDLSQRMLARRGAGAPGGGTGKAPAAKQKLVIVDDGPTPGSRYANKSSGCC